MSDRADRKKRPKTDANRAVARMVGRLLLWQRRCLRIGVEEFASLLEISRDSLVAWEKGEYLPREQSFIRMAEYVDLASVKLKRDDDAGVQVSELDILRAQKYLRLAQESDASARFNQKTDAILAYCGLIEALISRDEAKRRACGQVWI